MYLILDKEIPSATFCCVGTPFRLPDRPYLDTQKFLVLFYYVFVEFPMHLFLHLYHHYMILASTMFGVEALGLVLFGTNDGSMSPQRLRGKAAMDESFRQNHHW